MNFLQPAILWALPLVALPIIIHLINQRRYQTIRWAAMMFLLAANRMSRGYARLRQWLIMAFRMLAIAALTFAVSRPLAGGWLGMTAGGRPDTTIIVLDRSPSMQQGGPGASGSKLETGCRQLVSVLRTVGSARWVLIDGTSSRPRELESPEELLRSPVSKPSSAPSDIPKMLQMAQEYIRGNKAGRTEVWVCSDIRENDWNADSGRWAALREGFLEFPQGVRFHLLAYPQAAASNLAVRVTEARRVQSGDGAALLVSLRLEREGEADTKVAVPVQFEIEGARSVVTVELAGARYELKDHRIPIERSKERGWGKVSIPADANPADNEYWFAFDRPAPRHAVIVAEDPLAARPLELAASIPPDPSVQCSSEVVDPDRLTVIEWDKASLLLWQAPLPEGDAQKLVRDFLARGGQAIFFPPRVPGDADLLGVRWTAWVNDAKETAVENWRGDQDFLARTQSGAALPVGQLQVSRHCALSGEFTVLATLRGGAPLLARVASERGGVAFCTTTPAPADSSLASNGVVLYVLVQRALAEGAAVLERTRQLAAGDPPPGDDPMRWKRVAGADEAVSSEFSRHRGVYLEGDRMLAVNRPAAEDQAPVLADRQVAGLFQGLDFSRVDDQAGNLDSLIQEIWRLFLVGMIVALIVEAALCLPNAARPAGRAA